MNAPQAQANPPGMQGIDPNKSNNDGLKHLLHK